MAPGSGESRSPRPCKREGMRRGRKAVESPITGFYVARTLGFQSGEAGQDHQSANVTRGLAESGRTGISAAAGRGRHSMMAWTSVWVGLCKAVTSSGRGRSLQVGASQLASQVSVAMAGSSAHHMSVTASHSPDRWGARSQMTLWPVIWAMTERARDASPSWPHRGAAPRHRRMARRPTAMAAAGLELGVSPRSLGGRSVVQLVGSAGPRRA